MLCDYPWQLYGVLVVPNMQQLLRFKVVGLLTYVQLGFEQCAVVAHLVSKRQVAIIAVSASRVPARIVSPNPFGRSHDLCKILIRARYECTIAMG